MSFKKIIAEKAAGGKKIAMITAYDYPSALLAERGGADVLLVGDSLANVVLGYETTIPVTLTEMIYHTKAVMRGRKNALVIMDLPFGSYEMGGSLAMQNVMQAYKESGAHCLKLEGGAEQAPLVRQMTDAGIAVCAHVGLTPQSVNVLGGFKVQGREEEAAKKILADAIALEEAGAMMIVLECVPASLGTKITKALSIPTIGIGAGADCDGQVLVFHDMLNLLPREKPMKFVKCYDDIGSRIEAAISDYCREVKEGSFPLDKHSF